MSLGVHRDSRRKKGNAMAAGSSNGCPKVSSKSSGGLIKAMRKKKERSGWLWRRKRIEMGDERGYKRRILHVWLLRARKRSFVKLVGCCFLENHSMSRRAFIGGSRSSLRYRINGTRNETIFILIVAEFCGSFVYISKIILRNIFRLGLLRENFYGIFYPFSYCRLYRKHICWSHNWVNVNP